MQLVLVPQEVVDHASRAMTVDVPGAAPVLGGISAYRSKLYRVLLKLETARSSAARSGNKLSLFPRSSHPPVLDASASEADASSVMPCDNASAEAAVEHVFDITLL